MSDEPKKPKSRKKKPVDRATPVINMPKETDRDMVTTTRTTTTQMEKSSLWASSPALRENAQEWNDAADAIESNAEEIAVLRAKLAAMEAAQRANRARWRRATSAMLGTAAVVCAGSKDLVHEIGFAVLTRGRIGPLPAPGGIVAMTGKKYGEGIVTWQRGRARYDFMVQQATDPTDPSTWSALRRAPTSIEVKGAPRSLLYVRVAAMDPTQKTGTGPWSDWVAVTLA
jgi:hypothetical protein